MAGPGGREIGRVSARVVPDTSKFFADVKVMLERVEESLKVAVPLVLDGDGFAAEARRMVAAAQGTIPSLVVSADLDPGKLAATARATVAEAQRAAGDIDVKINVDRQALTALQSAFSGSSGLSGRAKLFAALGVAAAGATPGLLSVAGGLAQVVGAAALLPAAGAAAAVGVGALVIGLRGVGDAISESGDPEKYAEALKGLSPAAASFVKATVALGPAAARLKDAVQESLFTGLARQVQLLGATYLPIVSTAFAGVAASANNATRAVAGFLQSRATIADTTAALTNTREAFATLAAAAVPVVTAFRDIGVVGATFLPGLAAGVLRLSESFAAFIANARQTGQLGEFISSGLGALQALTTVAVQAGRAIYGIVIAAQAAGGGTLTALAAGLTTVANVINGPAFQLGLTQFFAGLQGGFAAVTAALPAVGQALAAIAPAIASVAVAFGTGLGAALTAVAGVIVQLSPYINRLAAGLADLSPKILALIAGGLALAPAFAAVASAVTGVVAVVSALSAPVVLVIGGIAALAAGLVYAYRTSSTFRDGIAQVGAAFQGLYRAALPIIQQLLAVVQQNMPQILAVTRQVFSTVQSVVIAVLANVRTQVQVVTAVVQALWAAFGTQILAVVQRVFPIVLSTIQGVLNVIQGAVRTFTAVLNGDWAGAWAGVQQVVSGAGQAISGIVRGFLAVVVAAVSAQLAAVRTLFTAGWNALTGIVTGAFGQIQAAVSAGAAAVVATVGTLPGRILGAVGNLGSLLYSAGVDVVQGLANGIQGAAGRAVAAARNLAASVANAARSALSINSPSRVMIEIGRFVGAGLVKGLDGSAGQVRDAATKLVNQIRDAATSYAKSRDVLTDRLEDQTARLKGATKKQRAVILRQIADTKSDIAELNKSYLGIGASSTADDRAIKAIQATQGQLEQIAKKRTAVAEKLEKAQDRLADAVKLRDDFADSVQATVIAFGNLTNIKGNLADPATVKSLTEDLGIISDRVALAQSQQAKSQTDLAAAQQKLVDAIGATGEGSQSALAIAARAKQASEDQAAATDRLNAAQALATKTAASLRAAQQGAADAVTRFGQGSAQAARAARLVAAAQGRQDSAGQAVAEAMRQQVAAGDALASAQRDLSAALSGAGPESLAAARAFDAVTTAQLRQQSASIALRAATQAQAQAQVDLDDANNGQALSASTLIEGLQDRLAAIRSFVANLERLKSAGLNDVSYRQLLDAGIEGGSETARLLAQSGQNVIDKVNGLQQEINDRGASLGQSATDKLYQAGVDAAQGLVAGLKSQAGALADAADDLADRLVSQVKKALQISSPSKVFADQIGRQIPAGIEVGMNAGQAALDRRVTRLVSVPSLANVGAASLGGGSGGGVNIYGNVGWDPYEVAAQIDTRTRDANAVAGLSSIVGVA